MTVTNETFEAWMKDRDLLLRKVEDLRALIKKAEWVARDMRDLDAACPWCDAWECAGRLHDATCPAFHLAGDPR